MNPGPWALTATAAALASLPWWGLPPFYESFLHLVCHWAILALSWNILSGYSGCFSFGHGAFFGVGMYTAAGLSANAGWPFLWTLPTLPQAGPTDPTLPAAASTSGSAADAAADTLPPATSAAPRPAAAKPLLVVDRLSKRFAGVLALDALSLQVREGEILGLLGPNGSGKSSFINVISGHYAPSGGSFAFEGRPLAGLPAHRIARSGIARTHQIPRPFAHLCVRDNVALVTMFGAAALNRPQALREADRWLAFTGLGERAAALPDDLNLHQRKFLELARALAARPRLVLLDEVLSGLTPAEIGEAVALIRRIRERGATIVFVEHVMPAVMALTDRLVVLQHGRLIAEGLPAQVMHDPAVVTAYLGRRMLESLEPGELRVQDLRVNYGAAPALWGVSLRVAAGELVCVVGPNGAGKTTLINTLAGLLRASGGSLHYGDEDLRSLPSHRFCGQGIAIVPEGRRLFTGMSVRDNLVLGSFRACAKARRAQTLDEVLALFPALIAKLDSPAGALSGGQQQMVAIGRAMMCRPALLLLDEPSLGLAPAIVMDMFNAIRTIHAAGTAVLLVEQNVTLAMQLAQRAYVIEGGRTVAEGEADALMQRPEIRRAYLGLG